uniref:Bestrophin homolog n=1 Tax=Strongyloides stercoralis TaxID=6248 RepID=A0A0K0E7Y7_STRER
MALEIATSFISKVIFYGWSSIFQLFLITVNYYLITLQRVLLSILVISGEIPVSRHDPISEKKGLFVYRIIRNYVNLIQYVRNWFGKWYDNDILKAAPVPILYEDDEIDESFFSNSTRSVVSVFGEYGDQECIENWNKNTTIKCTEKKVSNIWKIYFIIKQIVVVFFKTIFSYVEFPEESVNRISISSFSRKEILPIKYSLIGSKNPMETSDYQTDVEFIDDECF